MNIQMFKNIKVELSRIEVNPKDFNKKELTLIDCKGMSRTFLTITFDKFDDTTIEAVHGIIRNQYKLPMKWIECDEFSYKARKRDAKIAFKDTIDKMTDEFAKNKLKRCDYLYIEPLNNDYMRYIKYIPINQAIPLDTQFIIDINEDNIPTYKPGFYFFRSNSLKTDENIEQIIKKEKPSSHHLKPFLENVHIGSLDIDSKLLFKGRVALVNPDMCQSMTLFGFKRNDDLKYFKIFTYDCYNVRPVEIFEMMLKLPNLCKESQELCKAVIAKCPKK